MSVRAYVRMSKIMPMPIEVGVRTRRMPIIEPCNYILFPA